MNNYKKYTRKANKLIERLTQKIKDKPEAMCENYGQKEIRKFIDKMHREINALPMGKRDNLVGMEESNIQEILNQVSSIC